MGDKLHAVIDRFDLILRATSRQKQHIVHGAMHLTSKGGRVRTSPKDVRMGGKKKRNRIQRGIERLIRVERIWIKGMI